MADLSVSLDHGLIYGSDRGRLRGRGLHIYFCDPDGSLMEFIGYHE